MGDDWVKIQPQMEPIEVPDEVAEALFKDEDSRVITHLTMPVYMEEWTYRIKSQITWTLATGDIKPKEE